MRECIICESANKTRSFGAVEGFELLKCDACGLVYVDKVAEWGKLYQSYSGGFWKSWRRKFMLPFRGYSQVRNFRKSRTRAEKIVRFALENAPSKQNPKLLDIGCNKGFLLQAALEHGCNIYGIEVIAELTAPFRKKYREFGDNITCQKLAEAQKSYHSEMFDIISAIDVIEHLEDPVSDLRTIYRILKHDGILLLQTPDSECAQALELGIKWGALKPLEHLHIFNRTNLQEIAAKCGFGNVKFFAPFDVADGNFVAVLSKHK
jgi:SAM-dependent methyltransferase